MKQPFAFKQFSVAHDICAQKVGTDGVLLGAWTNILSDCKNILDIGTGSGLIAIMMAQRTSESVYINAIDIDKTAVKQASINFNSCKWSSRLKCFHTSIQNFQPDEKYDLIVCNPPFFSNSMPPENKQRRVARHDELLPLEELFFHANRLLSEKGSLAIILPFEKKNSAIHFAKVSNMVPHRICNIKGNKTADFKRVLLQFSVRNCNLLFEEENLIIEENRNNYTNEYKLLTKDFYLKF